MPSFGIVEREVPAQGITGISNAVGPEVDLLVLHAAPEAFDKDIIDPAPLAVHADSNVVLLEHTGKILARELTALVGIENLWCAVCRVCSKTAMR